MNRQEKELVLKAYKDCQNLKRKGKLTEYGEGQMDLCTMMLNKRNKKKNGNTSKNISQGRKEHFCCEDIGLYHRSNNFLLKLQ